MTRANEGTASAIARRIARREASSREVVEACLRRIDEVNGKLNAVVFLDAERALARARAADEAQARGESWGPLHGVPFTAKDSLDVEGLPCTAGTLGRRDFVSTETATVVRRLVDAGAILLGKTNMPELALAFETDNLLFGRTNNPYDLARTCGGSSGGEAAIVAAEGSPFGVGSDAGGSIRVPCHYCGLAGMRPTTGRVPRTGMFPPAVGLPGPLWSIGPLTRAVEDLALTLPILAGADFRDPAALDVPLGDPAKVAMAGLRVAVFTDNGVFPPTAETIAIVEQAASALGERGARVEAACPPGLAETADLFVPLLLSNVGADIRAQLRAAGTSRSHALLEGLLAFVESYPAARAPIAEVLVRLDGYRRGILSFMERYDLLLCPAGAVPAPLHGGTGEVALSFTHTETWNLLGWPAAVVRAGTSADGIPIGVQAVSRPWRDEVAIAAAAAVESALGGWRPSPVLP